MVERQGWGAITEGLGSPLRKVLHERRGRPTVVRKANGEELLAYDVVWGRDIGDLWEHVTLNGSPPQDDRPVHFLHQSEVESLWDPEGRLMLVSQVPAPGET